MRTGLLILVAFGLGCGDDTNPAQHEHEFTNYAQCYNHHTDDEGMAPQDALVECDEFFADDTAFADRDACLAYYADFPDVPEAEAQAHCETLFP